MPTQLNFLRGDQENLSSSPITNGQVYFSRNPAKKDAIMYMDMGSSRLPINSEASGCLATDGNKVAAGASDIPVYFENGLPSPITTLTITSTKATDHIKFSRASYNYITAPEGGVICLVPNAMEKTQGGCALYASGTTVRSNLPLTVFRETSIADNKPAQIKFSILQTDNNITTSSAYINYYDDHDAASNGGNLVIQSGGNIVIGSGESGTAIYEHVKTTYPTAENLFLAADGGMFFHVNCNNSTDKIAYHVVLDSNRYFYPMGDDNSTLGALGVNAHRWQHVMTKNLVLTSSGGYGSSLPAGGYTGRVFLIPA